MIKIQDIKLLDILPANISQDSKVNAAAQALSRELQAVSAAIKHCLPMSRIDEIPELAVDLLAWQFHVDFYDPKLALEQKRELVKKSLRWHKLKGTPAAVEEAIGAILAPAVLEEWWEYRGQPYFFRVNVNGLLDDEFRIRTKELIQAINATKNARSKFESILYVLRGDFTNQLTITLKQTLHFKIPAIPFVYRELYLDGSFNLDGTYPLAFVIRLPDLPDIAMLLQIKHENLLGLQGGVKLADSTGIEKREKYANSYMAQHSNSFYVLPPHFKLAATAGAVENLSALGVCFFAGFKEDITDLTCVTFSCGIPATVFEYRKLCLDGATNLDGTYPLVGEVCLTDIPNLILRLGVENINLPVLNAQTRFIGGVNLEKDEVLDSCLGMYLGPAKTEEFNAVWQVRNTNSIYVSCDWLKIDRPLWYLDGTYALDGERKLDAGLTAESLN